MIIIPELKTVVILVPRTGSGSLRLAIAQKYPESMLLYRHMEADGVPAGYDRWERVGVLRHPVDRLWSLYKFCKTIDRGSEAYQREMLASVDMSFSDWIVSNKICFTDPYDNAGALDFFPVYNVRHNIPETRKSQFLYLRPDLGTTIYLFEHKHELARKLGVTLDRHNATSRDVWPSLTQQAMDHLNRFQQWDYAEWSERLTRIAA